MFTKHILIQKIDEDGNADFYTVNSNDIQWTFENSRTQTTEDPDFFPFLIFGDNLKINKRKPASETKIYAKENEITFFDKYGVPEGFVIAILFPKNFILDMIKFKDMPIIPVRLQGQVIAKPPGQFQIFYNRIYKRSAIVFSIHENICFGFKCVAKKVADKDFPKTENVYSDEFFDVTISSEMLNIDSINNEDLKIINEVLDKSELEELNENINEILIALKNNKKEEASFSLNKLGKFVLNGTSLAGNLTKVIDSYNEGGAPQQFIARLFEHIQL